MKVNLNKENCTALKGATALARTRAVRVEDTAAYLVADAAAQTLYVRVVSEQDVTYEHTMPAQVAESGEAAVPGAVFGHIIARYDAPELSTVRDDKFVRVKESGSHMDVPIFSETVWPRITRPTGAKITIPAPLAYKGINDVLFAVVSAENRNHYGNNIMASTLHVVAEGNSLVFEGFCAYYGAKLMMSLSESVGNVELCIPQELAARALPVLKGKTGNVEFSYDSAYVSVACEGITLTSRRFVGRFSNTEPLYDSSFETPESPLNVSIVDAAEVKEIAAKALAVITPAEASTPVTFVAPASGAPGETTLAATFEAQYAALDVKVPCRTDKGEETAFSVIPRNLAQVFYGLNGDVAIFSTNNNKPLIISTTSVDDDITYTQARIMSKVLRRPVVSAS